MNNAIGVIDYGMAGNIYNIKKTLEKAGGKVVFIKTSDDFKRVDKIVIPGVGSFADAMLELKNNKLIQALKNTIMTKPTLGICLGMQILADIGFEYGTTQGLGIFEADVKKLSTTEITPHVGFNKVNVCKSNRLFDNLENEEFYFMHSYEVIIANKYVIAKTSYKDYQFVSSIQNNNIYGVQFHPEKSREAGIQMFANFINL